MSARATFHWGMTTFLVTPSMCCVFICTNSKQFFWKHLCAPHCIELEKTMLWPHLRFVLSLYVQTPIKLQFYAAEEIYSCSAQKKQTEQFSFIQILPHLMAWTGHKDFKFKQNLLKVYTYEKPACRSFATWSVPAIVNCLIGCVFRVRPGFVQMRTQHARVLAPNVLFSRLFPVGWCLLTLPHALAQTSLLYSTFLLSREFQRWMFCKREAF